MPLFIQTGSKNYYDMSHTDTLIDGPVLLEQLSAWQIQLPFPFSSSQLPPCATVAA